MGKPKTKRKTATYPRKIGSAQRTDHEEPSLGQPIAAVVLHGEGVRLVFIGLLSRAEQG